MRVKTFSNILRLVSPRRFVTSGLTALAIFGLIVLVNVNPWLHEQWVLSTTEQPERLTELYFDNPNNLPATVTAGKPVTVSYHVHNLEAQQTTYQVRVSLVVNGKVQTISQRSFVLPDDASVSIPVSFSASAAHQNLELVVDLLNENESIDFRSAS